MEKYVSCLTHTQKNKWRLVYNWRCFTSNILHSIHCEVGVLCVSFRNHLSLHFPDSCCFSLQPPEIPFQEFISFSPFSMACGWRVWVFVVLLVCLESIIHVSSLPRCTLLSGDERCALLIVILEMRFRGMGGAFFSFTSELHLTSCHSPSELKADNVQISGFTASFLSWSCFLFFSPEMKRNEIIVPMRHLFFNSVVLLWCFITTCQLSNTSESCLWSTRML